MSQRPKAVVATTLSWQLWQPHRDLIRALTEDHDVLLVSNPGPEQARLREQTGARTHELPMRKHISPKSDLVALMQWVRLLRRERPELVFAASPKGSLLALLSARITSVPRRVYFLGGLRLESEQGRKRALLVAMERLAAACAHVVVVNSPSQLERAVQLRLFRSDKAVTTTPASSHGVDSQYFDPTAVAAPVSQLAHLTPGVPVIGVVGRVTRDKGFDVLLDALDRLTTRGVALQLLVVGDADEPDSPAYLKRLAATSYGVVLTGHLHDVRECYRAMDVHVLASLREGFPNVVLEAAAMGVPTVTTASTGCVDSVQDGVTGFVVQVGRPDLLADAIGTLLADPTKRATMGAQGREWVTQEFRPEQVVASITRHCAPDGSGRIPLTRGTSGADLTRRVNQPGEPGTRGE